MEQFISVSVQDVTVPIFPFSCDSQYMWAVHSLRNDDGSVFSTAYRCHGYVTLVGTSRGVNCVVIQSDCVPWQLRVIGSYSSDTAGAWCVVAADSECDALAAIEVRSQVEGLFPRGAVSKSTRYKILVRDGFKCRYCGSSPLDGARLHVDHIVPVSRGGSNDEGNLCAACSDCNHGKGNRFCEEPPSRIAAP